MRIVFMGTPEFAVASLEALIDSEHEVVAVFTRADKPRDRGKKITFSPVKSAALAAFDGGIPVEQPLTLKSPESLELIHKYKPDCIVVVSYGMILPKEVLELPKYGCLNVHASLLPKYRGAAPINRCIMNGEKESGITIMQMDEGIDTGDMLMQEKTAISDDMTASDLHDVLARIGGELLVKALNNVENIQKVKQNDEDSSYAEKLFKSQCEINFSQPAITVNNFIRGLSAYPCAFTFFRGKRLKVYRAELGKVRKTPPREGIQFVCGDNKVITLTEVQPENGKRMKAVDYLKGVR